MNNKIILFGVFFAGLLVGLFVIRPPAPKTPVKTVENIQIDKQVTVSPIVNNEVSSFDAQVLFFDVMSHSGFQLGEYFDSVRSQLNEQQQEDIDRQLVDYAALVFSHRKEDKKAEQKLKGLVGNISTDKQVLEMLAAVYAENKDYISAIDALIEVKRLAQYTQDFVATSNKIKEYVEQNIHQLSESRQTAKEEAFYKYLLEKFPGEFEFKWKYALYAYQQNKYEYARYLLEDLRYLPDFSLRAAQLAEKIDFHMSNDSAAGVTVSLSKHGESYFVKALVNEHEPINLLIDTGASMTIISPELAYSLGLLDVEPVRLMNFQTANGEVTAPIVRLQTLRVGEYSLQDLAVGVLPVSGDGRIHGLLGMNFLKQFRFFVDQQNSTLELIAQP